MLKSDLVNQSSDLKSGPEMDDLQHSTAASPSTSGVSSSVNNSVVCVRHGETVWKCEGRTQGQLDSPLTGRGISQVHELAEKLDAERFDLVLCSPLGRAVQTAETLLGDCDENGTPRPLLILEGIDRESRRIRV